MKSNLGWFAVAGAALGLAGVLAWGQSFTVPSGTGSGGSATNAVTSLNGDTTGAQSIAVGTSGTDVAVADSGATHTINIPTASATARGALSAAHWSLMIGKLDSNAVLGLLAGTGAVTNLQSAGNSNSTRFQMVVNGTNGTGQIKTISAGSNITITEEGTNVSVAASGGAATTNFNVASFHVAEVSNMLYTAFLNVRSNAYISFLTVSNTFQQLGTNLAVQGTNLVLNGTVGNYFTNTIASSGSTNLIVTNLLDGQTVVMDVFVNIGTTVALCTAPEVPIPGAWYFDGAAIALNSNGWSRVVVSRYGTLTNVLVATPGYEFAVDGSIVNVTNHTLRRITQTLTPFLTNLPALSSKTFTYVPLGGTNISVRQAGGTNFFDVTGEVNALGSSGVTFSSLAGAVSNVVALKWNTWTNYVPGTSNFVFSFNTNRYELKNQTRIVWTNLLEEPTAVAADMTIHVHNTTASDLTNVWPAYGAQHGYFFHTNVNNPILSTTTLTTGKHGVASFTCFGTNIFGTWTEWP